MPKKPQEGVRAVVKRPGEAPVVVRLKSREEFEEVRRIVEGYVSPLFVKDVGCVWVDEDGLPKKLPYNCNGLVGTVVVGARPADCRVKRGKATIRLTTAAILVKRGVELGD